MLKRDDAIWEAVSALRLGMTKEEVLDRIDYSPDYFSGELVGGAAREIITYKARHFTMGIGHEPLIYSLAFEDGKLVAINVFDDYEQKRLDEIKE